MGLLKAVLIGAVLLSLEGCSEVGVVVPLPASALPSPVNVAGGTPSGLPQDTAVALPATMPTAIPTGVPTVIASAGPVAVTGTAAVSYSYVFPLQPPEVASYSEYHHDYPACDIFAPVGTAFVAVTTGVIDEVSYEDRWDPATDDPAWRGGRFVSIVGDDGVRYYGSHLWAVVPGLQGGMRVTAGQVLGYVGDSGDARGTPPHLHFGLSRPTFPGDWAVRRGEISPFLYLQAWQAGRQLTPDTGDR